MSRTRFLGRILLGTLIMFFIGWSLPGCGKHEDGEKEKKTGGEKKVSSPPRKSLEDMELPDTLDRAWFYDGDGSFALRAFWQADDGRIEFVMAPERGPRRGNPKDIARNVIVFYRGDYRKGPFKELGRNIGPEFTTKDTFALKDVKHDYFRAVVYDSRGNALHTTAPVNPEVKDLSRDSARDADRKTTKSKDEERKEPEPTQAVLTLVVLPFFNDPEAPAEGSRTDAGKTPLKKYYGTGLQQALRQFLSGVPQIRLHDPGYVDCVVGSNTGQNAVNDTNLARSGVKLRASQILMGSFRETDEGMKIDLNTLAVETRARMQVATTVLGPGKAEDAADDIARGIAATLNVEIKPEQMEPLRKALKALEERRVVIEKALAAHAAGKYADVVAAFDTMKPEDMDDPAVLKAAADAYAQTDKPLKAASLLAAASRLPEGALDKNALNELAACVEASNELPAALNVLGAVLFEDEDRRWSMAQSLMNRFVDRRVVKAAEAIVESQWPQSTPVWQTEVDSALFNPFILDGKLVLFATTDDDSIKTMIPLRGSRLQAGGSRRLRPSPDLYETCVYELATGERIWQRRGVFSALASPCISGDKLFGVGEKGPVAVGLKDGRPVWADESGHTVHPTLAVDAAFRDERAWWKTLKTAVVGDTLIVWNPYGLALDVFAAADGAWKGRVHYNEPWAASGQYFLEQSDGLHFMDRLRGKLMQLSETDLADAVKLTTKLRLIDDSTPALQGGCLYQVSQQTGTGGGFDYYVMGADAQSGDFKWLYPVLNPEPPVVAGGKLFMHKKSITGKQSMVVRMIDVNAAKAWTVDLGGTGIANYVPTMPILGGSAVLIGSQAAISAEAGKEGNVLWVNRNLPWSTDTCVAGNWLLVPPMVVDPKTGQIVMQLELPRGFVWETADVIASGDLLLLFERSAARVDRQTVYRTTVSAYNMNPEKMEKKEQPANVVQKAPERKKLSPDEIEKAMIESNVSAPVTGGRIYDLFRRIAALKHEATGKPEEAVAYLAEWMKRRPDNPDHLIALGEIMKPYAAMAGDYDTLIALLEAAGKDYPDKDASKSFREQAKTLVTEKQEAERARAYIEQAVKAKHDPAADWGNVCTAGGIGSRGGAATPPFNQPGWQKKVGKASEEDVVIPTEKAVLVLDSGKHKVNAFSAAEGSPLWEMENARTMVAYRGLVYVVGADVRAMTPEEGLVVWKKPLEEEETKGDAAIAAGGDRVFAAAPGAVFALDWASGKEEYRISVEQVRRLDLHGSMLVVGRGTERETEIYDAASGNRLWQRETGFYTLFDGRMYDFIAEYDKRERKVNATLVCRHLRTGRELWRRYFDLGADARREPTVVPPVVTPENIILVCGNELLLLGRGDNPGELLSKQTLGEMVSSRPVATPTIIYVPTREGKLTGYDLTNELSFVWGLPSGGHGVIAADAGTLYVLDGGELKSLRGNAEKFDDAYLASLVKPDEALPENVQETIGERGDTVKEDRFVSVGMIEGKDALLAKMDDKRLGSMAFRLLVRTGGMKDWQPILDEMDRNLPPGKRKVRGLTDDEKRILFAEIVQRRESDGLPVLKEAIRRGDNRTTAMVLDLMNTGDRSVYAPMVLQAFRDAVKEGGSNIVQNCAKALGRWQFEPALSYLIQIVEDDKESQRLSGGARKECAVAVGQFIGNTRAMTSLDKCARLGAKSPLAKDCINVLAKMGAPGVELVARILMDADIEEPIRLEALNALGDSGSPDAATHLSAVMLNRRNPVRLRGEAALALGKVDGANDKTIESLVEIMNDEKNDELLRNAAMHGIGDSGNVKAIPILIEVIGNQAVDNRRFRSVRVDQYLRTLSGGARVPPNQDDWRAWWEKNKDELLRKQAAK